MNDQNKSVFMISQSRSPGHKDVGQDCMSTSRHGDYEVNVLCDGHDRDGHLVARAICEALPKVILRHVTQRGNNSAPVEDELLTLAFSETSNLVCWRKDGIVSGMFVKIFEGKWANTVGYVGDAVDKKSCVVIIVDEQGYHRPIIPFSNMKRATYTGGCTCIAFVRNLKTNQCKIAQTGDSRSLIMFSPSLEDSFMKTVYGMGQSKNGAPSAGYTTQAHNVFNKKELKRIAKDFKGCYEIDGAFLVNPVTKFSIQPTRGFADFDVYGTGYISDPEMSDTFLIDENTFVFVASDGVFDDHVWSDEELVTFFNMHYDAGDSLGTTTIAKKVYDETLSRSLAGGYVDDISLFVFKGTQIEPIIKAGSLTDQLRKSLPSGESLKRMSLFNRPKSAPRRESVEEVKLEIPKATLEDRRKTVQRHDRGQYTEIQSLLQDIEANGGEAGDVDQITDLVLKRFAKQYGHDASVLNSGRSVSDQAAVEASRRSARLSKRS